MGAGTYSRRFAGRSRLAGGQDGRIAPAPRPRAGAPRRENRHTVALTRLLSCALPGQYDPMHPESRIVRTYALQALVEFAQDDAQPGDPAVPPGTMHSMCACQICGLEAFTTARRDG